jgi:hypothetical protein
MKKVSNDEIDHEKVDRRNIACTLRVPVPGTKRMSNVDFWLLSLCAPGGASTCNEPFYQDDVSYCSLASEPVSFRPQWKKASSPAGKLAERYVMFSCPRATSGKFAKAYIADKFSDPLSKMMADLPYTRHSPSLWITISSAAKSTGAQNGSHMISTSKIVHGPQIWRT